MNHRPCRTLIVRRAAQVAACLLFGGFVLPAPLHAAQQEPAQAPTEAPVQAPEGPRPIPLSETPQAADEVTRELSRIGNQVSADPAMTRIEDGLLGWEQTIDDDLRRLRGFDDETVLLRSLEDSRQSWIQDRSMLATPLEAVNGRFRSLGDAARRVGEIEARWIVTRDSLVDVDEAVAEPLRASVDGVLVAIAATRNRIQERQSAVLALQTKVSLLDARVVDALAQVEEMTARVSQQILTRDAEPLWRPSERDVGEFVRQGIAAFSERFETVRVFGRRNQGSVVVHFLLFVMLVAIGYSQRSQLAAWTEVAGSGVAVQLFSRPLSGAAIFALLAASSIYTAVPTSVIDVLLVATLIPVLRLAPALIRDEDRGLLYGLLGLFAAFRVASVMPDGSPLYRWSLLALSLAGFVGLARHLRLHAATLAAERGVWWRLAGFGQRLALAGLLVSIIANVLGWTRLAGVLVSATIQSGYAAVILWLFAAASFGIAAILPTTRVGDLLPSVRRRSADFVRVVTIVVQLTAAWIWLDATLTWFMLRDPLDARFRALADADLTFGGLEITVGSIFAAVLILVVTPLVSRFVRFVFMEEVRPRLSLPRGSADGVASLFHYFILTIGLVLAGTAAGLDATQVTVVVGALSVGIGFGLQNIVSNFISGLILIFERPISVGDRIAVGATQQVGVVTRIGIRASTVRTFDGAEVVVPNSDLISKEVTNWTLSDMQRRLEAIVAVEYGTDPQRVLDVLREVAAAHEDILDEPGAIAVFDGFAESSMNFRLLYWVPGQELLRVKTEVNLAIHRELGNAAIRVAFPRREIRVLGDDESFV